MDHFNFHQELLRRMRRREQEGSLIEHWDDLAYEAELREAVARMNREHPDRIPLAIN